MKLHAYSVPVCLSACLGLCQSLFAGEDEHRHHDSHVHGVAEMNLAVDASSILIELNSPAANIVGFEHKPRDEDEHKRVEQAIQRLQEADSLFNFTDDARCQLDNADVVTELEHGHDDHEHHGHDHDKSEDAHSEFSARYHFSCESIDKLKQVEVKLFDEFDGLEEVKAQVITPDVQSLEELTSTRNVIKIK